MYIFKVKITLFFFYINSFDFGIRSAGSWLPIVVDTWWYYIAFSWYTIFFVDINQNAEPCASSRILPFYITQSVELIESLVRTRFFRTVASNFIFYDNKINIKHLQESLEKQFGLHIIWSRDQTSWIFLINCYLLPKQCSYDQNLLRY